MIVLGEITSPFGVKGWCKVHSYTADRQSIFNYSSWQLQPKSNADNNELKTVVIDNWKQQGKTLIVHFKDIENRDAVLPFINHEILIDDSQLPDLDEGEFYWNQLIGLSVFNQQASGALADNLGVVSSLMATGANDVLVVDATADSIDQRQRLIPWLLQSTIVKVDLQQQVITVDWDSNF